MDKPKKPTHFGLFNTERSRNVPLSSLSPRGPNFHGLIIETGNVQISNKACQLPMTNVLCRKSIPCFKHSGARRPRRTIPLATWKSTWFGFFQTEHPGTSCVQLVEIRESLGNTASCTPLNKVSVAFIEMAFCLKIKYMMDLDENAT